MPIVIITARVDTIILLMTSQHDILPQLILFLRPPCPVLRSNLGSGKVRTTIPHIAQS